jgi:alpha-N-arabinofuranosidase
VALLPAPLCFRPELHGHFAEYLGSCTYGGLWVGKNSKIPNIDGDRKLYVDYLKALGVPVLRWHGGCFADDYHWRDGIGSARQTSQNGEHALGNCVEYNSFGHSRIHGLVPALWRAAVLRRQCRDWVEYCNYPSGSRLSDERTCNGSHDLSIFDIGEWATRMGRRYVNFMRQMGDTKPFLMPCWPSSNDTDWSRRLTDSIKTPRSGLPNGFSMHFYSRGKSPAAKFSVEELQDQSPHFLAWNGILQQRALPDGYDPDRKMGLIF